MVKAMDIAFPLSGSVRLSAARHHPPRPPRGRSASCSSSAASSSPRASMPTLSSSGTSLLAPGHHQRALPRPPRPPLPHPPCSSPPPSPTARREHVPVLGAPETGVRNACAGPGALDRLDRPECAGPDHRTGVSVTAASPRPRTGPHERERRSACTDLLHYPLTDRLKCTIAPVGVKRPAKDKKKTPRSHRLGPRQNAY